jgi:hypothetical protein
LLILAIGYGVGGPVGLVAAVIAVAVREAARMPARVLWVGAILAMAAAPLAVIAQGLPSTPITGVRLTATHLAANALVIVALILAVHAGMVELTEPAGADTAPLFRPPGARRMRRPAPAAGVEPDRTEPDAETPTPDDGPTTADERLSQSWPSPQEAPPSENAPPETPVEGSPPPA